MPAPFQDASHPQSSQGFPSAGAQVNGVARGWRCPIGVVELVLRIRARPKGIPAMVQALAAVMAQAGPQRGCVDCRLYAETGNPRSLCYVEQWSTLRDLQLQLRSPGFGMLLGIMETAPEAPALEVRTISEQRGLEYVSTIRLASPVDPCVADDQAPSATSRPVQRTPGPRVTPDNRFPCAHELTRRENGR